MSILALLVAYVVFGSIGYSLSKKFWQPKHRLYSILVLGVLGVFSLIGARLVSISEFVIYIHPCVEGLVIGILVRLFFRVVNAKRLTAVHQQSPEE